MKRSRRIGTLTVGLALIVLGIVFIAFTFFPNSEWLEFSLRFWPLILISLGAELLCVRFSKGEDNQMKVDFGSVMLMLLCVGFAFCCEGARQVLLALPGCINI
ncbi:MAG: DUF5668 domain-containing protein [Oscillospiraceae bacterium]